MAMNIFDKLFKKQEPEKSKDMSHWSIYDAILNIANDNNCYLGGAMGHIRVPSRFRAGLECAASYAAAPLYFEGTRVHAIIGDGIPISFSEDAHAIEYIPTFEKLKNDTLSSLL